MSKEARDGKRAYPSESIISFQLILLVYLHLQLLINFLKGCLIFS